MTDRGDEVTATRRAVTADEVRALQRQCSRCVLADLAPALGSGLVAGVAVALATGPTWVALLSPLVVVVLAGWRQVASVREGWSRALPAGTTVETVLGDHLLVSGPASVPLPQVTGVRPEGGVLRLDLGVDHTHVLPAHVDAAEVRSRAGRPAPVPVPYPGAPVATVPRGLANRAGTRLALWQATRSTEVLVAWVLAAVLALVGLWSAAATLLVAQAVNLVVARGAHARAFEATFPADTPARADWDGRVLVVHSSRGSSSVDLTGERPARLRGDLVEVLRPGTAPLLVPGCLLGERVRAALGLPD